MHWQYVMRVNVRCPSKSCKGGGLDVFMRADITESEFRGRTRRLLFVCLLVESQSVTLYSPSPWHGWPPHVRIEENNRTWGGLIVSLFTWLQGSCIHHPTTHAVQSILYSQNINYRTLTLFLNKCGGVWRMTRDGLRGEVSLESCGSAADVDNKNRMRQGGCCLLTCIFTKVLLMSCPWKQYIRPNLMCHDSFCFVFPPQKGLTG